MKSTTIIVIALLIANNIFSQSFNFMVGDRRSSTPIEDPETETFENNGNKYILYQAYSMKDGMQVQLQGYKPNNDYLCSKKLYVPEEKMLISIYEGFLNLENNMQLVKSTFNKEAKKLGESAEQEIQQMRLVEETIFFPFVLNSIFYSITPDWSK